jgi:hypothetical protein
MANYGRDIRQPMSKRQYLILEHLGRLSVSHSGCISSSSVYYPDRILISAVCTGERFKMATSTITLQEVKAEGDGKLAIAFDEKVHVGVSYCSRGTWNRLELTLV